MFLAVTKSLKLHHWIALDRRRADPIFYFFGKQRWIEIRFVIWLTEMHEVYVGSFK